MAIVYVVQPPIYSTREIDLEPAKQYGELVYLFDKDAKAFNIKPLYPVLSKKLESFTEDDSLLQIGDTALCSIVFLFLSNILYDSGLDEIPLLKYFKPAHAYIRNKVWISDAFNVIEH